MSSISKLPFYIFLVYPIFGYLTINYFGLPPFIILSAFAIIAFLMKLITNDGLKMPPYLIYFIFYIISIVVSKYIINGVEPKLDTNFAQVMYSLIPLMLYFIVENSKIQFSFIQRNLLLIKYLVFAAALVSIIQYFVSSFFVYEPKYGRVIEDIQGYARRVPSIFTYSDFPASRYISLSFIIMYGILLAEYKEKKTMFFIIQILVAVIVFLSQFRIAMLTYVIATLFIAYRKFSFKNSLLILFFLFSFYFVIDLLDFNVGFFVEYRLKSESAFTRIDAFTAFFHAFPENWIFGTGGITTDSLYEGFGHIAQLHNAHLAIAYHYGIFAFIFHTLFIISLTRVTYQTGKEANYWPPFTGMLCYIAATMTMPAGYFLLPGLIIMMIFNKYYYDINKDNKTIHSSIKV